MLNSPFGWKTVLVLSPDQFHCILNQWLDQLKILTCGKWLSCRITDLSLCVCIQIADYPINHLLFLMAAHDITEWIIHYLPRLLIKGDIIIILDLSASSCGTALCPVTLGIKLNRPRYLTWNWIGHVGLDANSSSNLIERLNTVNWVRNGIIQFYPKPLLWNLEQTCNRLPFFNARWIFKLITETRPSCPRSFWRNLCDLI